VLYVGDEVRDMEAARKASVDIAAVGWGFHSLAILADERPKFLGLRRMRFYPPCCPLHESPYQLPNTHGGQD
jgi:hypothetical protein